MTDRAKPPTEPSTLPAPPPKLIDDQRERLVQSCMPPTVTRRPSSRYDGGEPVARGGMGAIVGVVDTELGRRVVMKQLHERFEREPDALLRFVEEARLTARLSHPNIVPVHELGVSDDGRPYFTMKRVEGRTLAEEIAYHRRANLFGRADLLRRLRLFLAVCNAVGFAHAEGVVHRDIKPNNVMVGEFGQVLLMDWGLAKPAAVDEAAGRARGRRPSHEVLAELTADSSRPDTPYGQLIGTPGYMAPEQASGQPSADPRVDIFSLGAMLCELVALRPAFVADGPGQMLVNNIAGEHAPPGSKEGDPPVPRELIAVTARAMAATPAERYPSVPELVADIEAYIAGHSVSALRDSTWQRSRKWLARHPRLVVALIAAVTTLALNVGLQGVLQRQVREGMIADHASAAEARVRQVRRLLAPGDVGDARAVVAIDFGRLRDELARQPIDSGGQPRWAPATAALLAATASLDRALMLDSGRVELRRRRRQLGTALVFSAMLSGDDSLADQVASELGGFGAPAEAVRRLRGAVAHWATRRRRYRLERVEALIAERAPVGEASRPRGGRAQPLEDAVIELLGYRDDAVHARLAEAGAALQARLAADRAASRSTEWTASERRRLALVCRVLSRTDADGAIDALAPLAAVIRARRPLIELTRGLARIEDLRARLALARLHARVDAPTWRALRPLVASLAPLGEAAEEVPGEALIAVARFELARRDDQGPAADAVRLATRALEPARASKAASGSSAGPVSSGAAYLLRARALVRLDRGSAALADCERALAALSAPADRAAALTLRAQLRERAQQADAALADYARAIELAPALAEARLGRGRVRRARGDRTGALSDLDAALDARPRLADALFERGMTRLELGQREAALLDFARLDDVEPRSARAAAGRGRVALEVGSAREAMAAFDEAIRLDPTQAGGWVGRGLTHFRSGRKERAVEDLRRGVALEPHWADAQYNLGIALAQLGRSDAAVEAYSAALRAAPWHAQALVNRGVLHREAGRTQLALRDFDRALEVDPRRWESHVNLGGIKGFEQGRKAEGARHLQRALELCPPEMRGQMRRWLEALRRK